MSDATLSFTAEQLLGALERQVLGDATSGAWLQALRDRDPGLAVAAAQEAGVLDGAHVPDIDALLVLARDQHQASLTRSDVAVHAAQRAAEAGRTVAGTADVAAAVLAAVAGSVSSIEEPEPVEPAPAEPEPVEPEPVEPAPAEAPVTVVGGRPRTFRLFVSSPFKDLEAERNALHEHVYPALSAFCAERGARFQPIDLRWGVSEEASLDQQAMRICLEEIERCRSVTPRPNFLVLLGNRYGWLALPEQIPVAEWDRILERVTDADQQLLERWYHLDANAVPEPDRPGARRLRPRTGPWAPPGHVPTEPVDDAEARAQEELERWETAETELRRILLSAVSGLELPDERRRAYEASATEQEIRAGALHDPHPSPAAHCFIRELVPSDDPDQRAIEDTDPALSDFVDPAERADETGPLADLKAALGSRVIGRYEARWRRRRPTDEEAARGLAELPLPARAATALERSGITTVGALATRTARELDELDGIGPAAIGAIRSALDASGLGLREETGRPTAAHLDRFAEDVRATLEQAIAEALEQPDEPTDVSAHRVRIRDQDDDQDLERAAHRAFAEERIQSFVGRHDLLASIDDYLAADDPIPLVVHGAGGTGKSAVLAEALRRALDRDGPTTVYRFIGATPGSANGRTLLEGLCRELAWRTGSDPAEVPSDFESLVSDLKARLRAGGEVGPLVVLIDSLDQLSAQHGARRLSWIPQELPPQVRLVVSTRPGETLEPLRIRLDRAGPSGTRLLEVGPMSREDGDELLVRWLSEGQRTLQDAQRRAVLNAFVASAGNPLYLRLAFEEARLWRSDEPPETLELGEPTMRPSGEVRYADAVEAVIERNTFHRLEDEENHGQVLVSRALGYLAASRNGLAEDELLALLSSDPEVYGWFVHTSFHVPTDLTAGLERHLGADARRALSGPDGAQDPILEWVRRERAGEQDELGGFLAAAARDPRIRLQLPVVLWSRLYADLAPYLAERAVEGATLIGFYHRELHDVAARRYLPDEAIGQITDGRTLHSRLAGHFQRRADPLGDRTWATDGAHVDLRGLSELPFHLTHARRWDDLHDVLTDFRFLEQKAARVDVDIVGEGQDATTLYRGVFALQEDFDTALREMPGGDGDPGGRRRLIVTVTDLGAGLALRCPHCNTAHPVSGECPVCSAHHDLGDWRGREIDCPNPACHGPLKVNEFVVERT